jgi:glutathione S-transferase
MRLVIGDKNLSSWSLRPWLLLRHAGIAFEEELRLFDTPGWRETIKDVSPSGRVPCLVDGALAIGDSLAIAEYVAEKFPDARLWPADREARAVARSVSAEMHAGFANVRSELSMEVAARFPRRRLSIETERELARILAIWSDCRARFGEKEPGQPFLFGRFSIADAMFAPVAFRLRTYDVEVTDARARAWRDAMLELPAMKEWERGAEDEARRAHLRRRGSAEGGTRNAMPAASSAAHVYAAIFTSQRRESDNEDYQASARAMEELAKTQPGYVGFESARGADGFGITVSYWDSLAAIRAWKDHPAHAAVRDDGRARFYERYSLRVASVDRAYEWSRTPRPKG